MSYPIDPKQGFLRTPDRYPHDAFAVDTGGRVRPHSGIDSTPRVAGALARSVLGGVVTRADWTIYAGNYVVERAPDGWLWLSLHLASRLVRPGAVLKPGDPVGVVGNTGGGGTGPLAGKTGMATHLHTSRCRDDAAVDRIVHGRVRPRYKGETNAQWAAAHGLSDPLPHINAAVKASAEAEKAGFLMALNDTEQARVLALLEAQESSRVALVTNAKAAADAAAATAASVAAVVQAATEAAEASKLAAASAADVQRRLVYTSEDGKRHGWDWLPYMGRILARVDKRVTELDKRTAPKQ